MDPYIYRFTRFILLLLCLIPSIICYFLIFYFLFTSRDVSYKHLRNHFILVLLVFNFLLIISELPITLVFSYYGSVQVQYDQFCSFWVAYNYGLYVVGLFLMAFGSIERYFLIFHERFVRRWQFILHYPPLVICFMYPLMFYALIIGLYPCQNTYDFGSYVCGGTCYQFEIVAGTVDYLINAVSPTFLIVLANLLLLVRVTYQKREIRVANAWRKTRLMYIQLISISILYFIVWIPFVSVSIVRLFVDPFFLQDLIILVLNYCLYICPLASPFFALVGLPAMRRRITKSRWWIFRCRGIARNRIRPIAVLNRLKFTFGTRQDTEV